MRIVVVGSTGRVGRALCHHLSDRYEVIRVTRSSIGEDVDDLARRAVADHPDVMINAAGVAHIEQPTADDLIRLERANVELPAALAAAAVEAGTSMIHISSVKAALDRAAGPYAASKRRGDLRLECEYGPRFEAAGLALTIVRPLALLFPPLTAGKVARLRFLRWWPARVIPPIRVPVLAADQFLGAVEDLVLESGAAGVRIREFGRGEYGSLRDVGEALKAEAPRPHWRPRCAPND